MVKVGDILKRLAVDLNDADGEVWGREQLRNYLADAMRIVFGYKPELFVRSETLTIRSCEGYADIAPCDSLDYDGVTGAADEHGHVLHTLRPCSDDAAFRWTARSCGPPGRYRMRDYSLAKDGQGIRVSPPLPPGSTGWIAVRCPVRPTAFGDDVELDEEIAPIAVQWCLCQAKLVDGENNVAVLAVARAHEEEFWKLLGVVEDERGGRRRKREGS
jgi:hypothetical protein